MSEQPKYPRPKILLVDLENEAEHILKNAGYNVSSGTFGVPYHVLRDDDYSPVIPNGYLPNFNEQEVVVVNLVPGNSLKGSIGQKVTSPGEPDWWASNTKGMIDPRPRLMAGVQSAADRILLHGGIFIVFADSRNRQELYWAIKRGYSIAPLNEIHYDN